MLLGLEFLLIPFLVAELIRELGFLSFVPCARQALPAVTSGALDRWCVSSSRRLRPKLDSGCGVRRRRQEFSHPPISITQHSDSAIEIEIRFPDGTKNLAFKA
jgi:hypothetical protein